MIQEIHEATGKTFASVTGTYALNADVATQTRALPAEAAKPCGLHPVQADPGAGDPPARDIHFDAAAGTVVIPARTAVVFVLGIDRTGCRPPTIPGSAVLGGAQQLQHPVVQLVPVEILVGDVRALAVEDTERAPEIPERPAPPCFGQRWQEVTHPA